MPYQSFLISNLREGQRQDVEPWLLPEDAFETMDNCYLHRGVIKKRKGYLEFGRFSEWCASISAITRAANGVVTTSANHGLATNAVIRITGSDMTEVNGEEFTVTVSDATHFTLGVNTSGYVADGTTGTVWVYTSDSIMGIMRFVDSSGDEQLIVANEDRLCKWDTSNLWFEPIIDYSENIAIGNGVTTNFTHTTQVSNVVPGSVTISATVTADANQNTLADDGVTPTGDLDDLAAADRGDITYATGAVTLNYGNAPDSGKYITITYQAYGDVFTGDEDDFFFWTNFDGKLWFTNGVDRIKTWDGSVIDSPVIDVATNPADPVSGTLVQTCKQLFNLKERLILLRTKEAGTWYPQRIRWSQAGSVTVWRDSVAGEGDYIDVSTGQFFQGANYLKDNLVVLFDRSVWILRYTGDPNLAFRIDKLNSLERTDCPGAILSFDDFVVGLGVNGIFACDGNSTKRIDDKIPDFTLEIDQDYIQRCFGKIVDEEDQMWITYVKYDEDSSATKATNIVVWNYKDNAWSTYDIALSCIGEYFLNGDKRLNQFGEDTLDMHEQERLNSFIWQSKHPIILGGSHDGGDYGGYVWQLLSGNADNTSSIAMELVSARWNPFNQQGKDTRLGKIDFYADTDGDDEISVDFYVNEDTDSYQTSTLDFDGIGDKSWHTLHSGAIGNTHRIKLTDTSANEYVEIHAIRLTVEPVGRGVL